MLAPTRQFRPPTQGSRPGPFRRPPSDEPSGCPFRSSRGAARCPQGAGTTGELSLPSDRTSRRPARRAARHELVDKGWRQLAASLLDMAQTGQKLIRQRAGAQQQLVGRRDAREAGAIVLDDRVDHALGKGECGQRATLPPTRRCVWRRRLRSSRKRATRPTSGRRAASPGTR